MSELNPVPWLQNSGANNSAQLMRMGVGGLVGGLTSGITPRGGVVPSLGGALEVTAGSGLSVDVDSGTVYVPGTSSGTQGVYVCTSDATVNLSLDAADGSNDRIDLIVARIKDSFYDAGPDDEWALEVVTGTPAGTPSAPTPTFDSFETLAEVLIPATATSPGTITDTRRYVVATGGILIVADEDELPSTGLYDGFMAFIQSLDLTVFHSGGTWTPISDTVKLDHVEPSGSVGTGAIVSIPSFLRGRFTSYTLEIDGHVSVSEEPLVVRLNGDSGSNYRVNAYATDQNLTTVATFGSSSTAFPRMGYLGEFGGYHRIHFRPRSTGSTGLMQWTAQGWGNEGGSGNHITASGGRWNGTVQAVENFTVRTTDTGHTWGSNVAITLWGHL